MTASVTYDADNLPAGLTPDNSLAQILGAYDDAVEQGSHNRLTGSYFGGDTFNGSRYTYYDPTTGYSFEADGDLHYYFPPLNGREGQGPTPHTLYGELDSVTLGHGETNDGHVQDPFLTVNFEPGLVGAVSQGRSNDVHDVIWGLMNGSTKGAADSSGNPSRGGLINALSSEGLDLNASLSSQGSESDLTNPISGLPNGAGPLIAAVQRLVQDISGFFHDKHQAVLNLLPHPASEAQAISSAAV